MVAAWLPHSALALGPPRRCAARSITSSWYSEATWISSSAIATGCSNGSSKMPCSAARNNRAGRIRLLPRASRCSETARRPGSVVVITDGNAPDILARAVAVRGLPSKVSVCSPAGCQTRRPASSADSITQPSANARNSPTNS